jgi:hypothetical protein
MYKFKEPNNISPEEDIGLILWKLESIENFYSCYTSMIKKE